MALLLVIGWPSRIFPLKSFVQLQIAGVLRQQRGPEWPSVCKRPRWMVEWPDGRYCCMKTCLPSLVSGLSAQPVSSLDASPQLLPSACTEFVVCFFGQSMIISPPSRFYLAWHVLNDRRSIKQKEVAVVFPDRRDLEWWAAPCFVAVDVTSTGPLSSFSPSHLHNGLCRSLFNGSEASHPKFSGMEWN